MVFICTSSSGPLFAGSLRSLHENTADLVARVYTQHGIMASRPGTTTSDCSQEPRNNEENLKKMSLECHLFLNPTLPRRLSRDIHSSSSDQSREKRLVHDSSWHIDISARAVIYIVILTGDAAYCLIKGAACRLQTNCIYIRHTMHCRVHYRISLNKKVKCCRVDCLKINPDTTNR